MLDILFCRAVGLYEDQGLDRRQVDISVCSYHVYDCGIEQFQGAWCDV